MSLVDAASQDTSQRPSKITRIVEVKDAGISTDPEADVDDYKRTLQLEHWRRRLRAKDFVDRLLAKEETEAEADESAGLSLNASQNRLETSHHQPLQMPFDAVVENGLMRDNYFYHGSQVAGSLRYAHHPGATGLSASTPTLSSTPAFNQFPPWQWTHNNSTNFTKYTCYNYYAQS